MTSHSFVGLLALATVLPCSSSGGETFRLPPRERVEVYDALRGLPLEAEGYYFTVSPDDQWLAVVRPNAPVPGLRLTVFNRMTRRSWDLALPDQDELALDWLPNCFSADSKKIFIGDRAANLSPSMTTLDARPAAPPPRGRPALPEAQRQREEIGMIVRSGDGSTLYESAITKQVRSSFLRVTPPGRDAGVDYAALIEAFNSEMKPFADEMRAAMRQENGTLTSTDLEHLLAVVGEVDPSTVLIRLAELSISPDQRFLAGVATLYRGSLGSGGVPYGVVIPLDRGGFVAFPFAKNVYGKARWSADSTALYFYAQPTTGAGTGTVQRVAVSAMGLPTRVLSPPPPVAHPIAPRPAA